MKEENWDVDWKCPHCGAMNTDNLDETANPVCFDCDDTFFWGEIAPNDLRAYNSSFAECGEY